MDGYPILQALIKANSPEKHPELQKTLQRHTEAHFSVRYHPG